MPFSKYSSVVSIVVGKDNPVTFTVSKDLVTCTSKFFDAAFKEPFAVARFHPLKLPKDDPGLFSIVIEAVYAGNIVSDCHAYRALEQFEKVQLYLLLDKFDFVNRGGKQTAEDHLHQMISTQFGYGEILDAMIVAMIFSNSVSGSPLRERSSGRCGLSRGLSPSG